MFDCFAQLTLVLSFHRFPNDNMNIDLLSSINVEKVYESTYDKTIVAIAKSTGSVNLYHCIQYSHDLF